MPKPVISEDLIVLEPDIDSQTAEDVIAFLCERLVQGGYVDSSYCQAVLDRERHFPTGLPTLPYPTAIPHADADGVRQTGVAIAILNRPVPFRAMGSPNESLLVKVVLLMAIANSSKQVSMLKWVGTVLQDQGKVEALASARDSGVVLAILNGLVKSSNQEQGGQL